MANAIVTVQGGQSVLPTLLGRGPVRIPTAGKIRPGIMVLTKKAAEVPGAKDIYLKGVAAGLSFEQIEKTLQDALPQLKSPLVPRNVPWFTVRAQDFPNPEVAQQILDAYGEDHGKGRHLYRFPVVFPADHWQSVMPHELAAWGAHEKRFWSQYSSDGQTRHCMCHAPIPMDHTGRRTIRIFGGRKTELREDNGGICDPESCREYQARQCNLTGRFLFFVPGIRTLSALELPTTSFYAMSNAIQRFQAIGHMRGGRISGFLGHSRETFFLTKVLRDVPHIDENGRAVRVPQWIIELEAPIDVTALLRDDEDQDSEGWRFEAVPPGARALLTCVPTINKAVVAATVGAVEVAQAVGEHLALLLRGFAPINRRARARGVPTVAVSHGTVFGSLSEHGVPMAGFDHEFSTGVLFSAETQAVMLGHIHRHQLWEQDGPAGRQCIAYAGSIGRFHYGEQGEKGFLLWEVTPEGAACELMPTPARRTIDIVFEGRPDLAALRAAIEQHGIDGTHVRVRWTVADEDRHAVDRATIARLLADAAHVKLEGRIVPLARARAPGISQLASLADKVREWTRLVGVDAESVVQCLESLQQGSPAEIAEGLLAKRRSEERGGSQNDPFEEEQGVVAELIA